MSQGAGPDATRAAKVAWSRVEFWATSARPVDKIWQDIQSAFDATVRKLTIPRDATDNDAYNLVLDWEESGLLNGIDGYVGLMAEMDDSVDPGMKATVGVRRRWLN